MNHIIVPLCGREHSKGKLLNSWQPGRRGGKKEGRRNKKERWEMLGIIFLFMTPFQPEEKGAFKMVWL